MNIAQIAADNPNRQPQLAGHSILIAQSHDNGSSSSPSVTVAEKGALAAWESGGIIQILHP